MNIFILLALLCLIAAWLLPNHYFPWTSAYSDQLSFLSILLLSSGLLTQRQSINLPTVSVAIAGLATVPWLQYSFGIIIFSGDALTSSAFILAFATSIALGYNYSLTCRKQQKSNLLLLYLAVTLLLGACISAVLALQQWLLQAGGIWVLEIPRNGRPYANLAQPNNLATLLCMGLAAIIYLFELNKLNRFTASLLSFCIVFTIALTQSRTPWLASIAIGCFWAWKSHAGQTRLKAVYVIIWITVFFSLVFLTPVLSDILISNDSQSVSQRAQSLHRWDLYVQFFHAIIQGPLWGYGWNQTLTAQLLITPYYPVQLITGYTHNFILDILIWNGPIIGGVTLLLTGFWLFRVTVQAKTKESLFCLVALGFFATHSMLEYPHAYAFFLLPAGLLIGFLQAESNKYTYRLSIKRALLIPFLIFSAILQGWLWYEYVTIENDFRLMRFESAHIGNVKAERPAPKVILLNQLREYTRSTRSPATTDMSEEKIYWLQTIAMRFPHPHSLFNYAKALALNGYPEQAREQLNLIEALHGESTLEMSILALEKTAETEIKINLLLTLLKKETNEYNNSTLYNINSN